MDLTTPWVIAVVAIILAGLILGLMAMLVVAFVTQAGTLTRTMSLVR